MNFIYMIVSEIQLRPERLGTLNRAWNRVQEYKVD
jgi:hypothetical protein